MDIFQARAIICDQTGLVFLSCDGLGVSLHTKWKGTSSTITLKMSCLVCAIQWESLALPQ